jgi:hypothetical protein
VSADIGLLPTHGIADPQVRAWLDRFTQAWGQLMTGDGRAITKDEFDKLAGDALAQVLSDGAAGIGEGTAAQAVNNLTEAIRKTVLFQALEQQISPIQLESLRDRLNDMITRAQAGADGASAAVLAEQQARIDGDTALTSSLNAQISRIDGAEAAIVSEQTTRASADAALTTSINAAVSRLDTAEAAIVTEQTTRAAKDSALASAINNIWASIGGSEAVIQDGTLAAATPSTAVATKWSQVVAAVTDPNTGNVSSASILQESRTYASNNNSTLNALYTVRAQISSGGQTVVGGFGLAATAGAGSAQGPSIDFGVIANKFWIAAPAGTYDPAAEYSANLGFPFIVVSTPTTINGVTYSPGVYMKKAVIGDASIDTAKIAQNIRSNNFNGTFDGSGNIATNGSAGWALDKSGKFVVNNIYARGDIQATSLNAATGTFSGSLSAATGTFAGSLTAQVVNTGNIVGAAVTTGGVNVGGTGTTASNAAVGITVNAGDRAILVIAYPGMCYSGGSGESDPGGQVAGYGTLYLNGSPIRAGAGTLLYMISDPGPGGYTFQINSSAVYGGTFIRGSEIAVLLTRR